MWQRTCRSLNRLAVVAVAGGLTVALISETGQNPPMQPPRLAAYHVVETAAITQLPTSIGIAEGADLFFMSKDDVELTMKTLKSLGVTQIRVAVFWAVVESTEGQYDWTNVDRVVKAAEGQGMNILATINHTPDWAGDPYLSGHPDPQKYGEFAADVAQRYAGRVSAYEIWNEPTTSLFWNPVDPAAYTEMLKAAYTAIKQADPSAVVVGGSVVAGPNKSDGSAMDPVDFIAAMYANGAHGYFDALSYHPYQYTTPFSAGQNLPDFDYPIEQLAAIRALMAQNGDGNVKVWITEYGQPTLTLSDGTVLSQQQQADYIEDLIRTWQTVDGAGPVFLYNARDTETGSSQIDDNFGLYQTDWMPKLAAGELAALIKELTKTSTPVNPVAAFFQQIITAITNAFNFIPNLIGQVFRAVTNWLGGLFGIRPAAAAAATEDASVERRSAALASDRIQADDPEPTVHHQDATEADPESAAEREPSGVAQEVEDPPASSDVDDAEDQDVGDADLDTATAADSETDADADDASDSDQAPETATETEAPDETVTAATSETADTESDHDTVSDAATASGTD